MARLMLRLLGTPYLEDGGAQVTFETRKALALLAFLALNDGVHARETLAALLWPELDQPHAFGALRYTLSILKKHLGIEPLAITRDHAGLASNASLAVDVRLFEHALQMTQRHKHMSGEVCPACIPVLSSVIAQYHGDFMSGFTLRDSAAFDEWQLLQRERLQHTFAHALERLAQAHAAGNNWKAAISTARRWLALDPLHEPAHALLMQCYSAAGRRSTALRQYAIYAALVQRELDAPPSDEMTRLYDDIKQRRVSAPSAKLLATQAFPQAEIGATESPVFVARESELARLARALDQARHGHGQVHFVVGEAGSGKSALLHSFAQRAQHDPTLVVLAASCNGQTGPSDPFLPFRAILQALVGTSETTIAATVNRSSQPHLATATTQVLRSSGAMLIDTFVPEQMLADNAASLEFPDRREQASSRPNLHTSFLPPTLGPSLQEQYTKVLETLAAEQPLLLLLDDLQWADAASIELLFHLGRHINYKRVLIIGAYRADDLERGRGGQRHPLLPVVHELARLYGDIQTNLDDATEASGKHLVDALIDSSPNDLDLAFRDELYRQTGGQPLFTVEVLRGLQERGNLVYDQQGRLVRRPAIDWSVIPARVEAVIAERFERLGEDLRELLTIASVEGEVLTAEVIAWVQASEARGIRHALSEELDRRQRFVRALGCDRVGGQLLCRYRFRHVLYQKYLYSQLDPVERALLHGEVGAVLETLYGPESTRIAVELARHFHEAGDAVKAAGYFLLAAQQALRLSADTEALEHCNRGIALLQAMPNTPTRTGLELELQMTLGACLNIVKGHASTDAAQVFNRALQLSTQLNEQRELFIALRGIKSFHDLRLEYNISQQFAYQLLRIAEQSGDPLLLPLAYTSVGFTLLLRGKLISGSEYLERAVTLYDPEQHHALFLSHGPDPGVTMLSFLSWGLWLRGYPDQARQRSEEAIGLAKSFDQAFSQMYASSISAVLYQLCRDVATSCKRAEDALAGSEQFALFHALAQEWHGWARAMQGELVGGLEELRAGYGAVHATGAAVSDTHYHALVADIYGRLGQMQPGLAHVREGLDLVERSDERYYEAELHRVQGELLQATSPLDAEASFRQALAVAAGQHAKSLELRAALGLARLLQRQNRGDEALALLHPIYNWFTEGFDTPDLQEAQQLLALHGAERHLG